MGISPRGGERCSGIYRAQRLQASIPLFWYSSRSVWYLVREPNSLVLDSASVAERAGLPQNRILLGHLLPRRIYFARLHPEEVRWWRRIGGFRRA